VAALAAGVLLTAIYVFGCVRDLSSGPHVDEVEHLQAALRMARGERIFVDFHEHHSPLYYATLVPLVPDGEGVAVMRGYLTRARVVAGVCVAIALAIAVVLVMRATASATAGFILAALVLGAGSVWRDGLGDVRPESPSLALWWSGAALVLLGSRGVARGAGLGLVVIAALVNPKWPIVSIVVGVFFLADLWRQKRERIASLVAASVVAVAGLAAVAAFSDLRLAAFHVVELSRGMVEVAFGRDEVRAQFRPFFGCPAHLRPWAIAAAAALIAIAWARRRATAFASPRIVAFFVAVAAASLAEIVFVYPFPIVDRRYYAFWVIPSAAVLALAARSAVALLEPHVTSLRTVIAAIPGAVAVLAFFISLDRVIPFEPWRDPYWASTSWIEWQMKPGDTVWLEMGRHPIGARDANYYWFGFEHVIPVALRAARAEETRRFVPAIAEQDLPPCRMERGLDAHVRFIAGPDHYAQLPVVAACFERLRARGAVSRTPLPDVWIVNR